MINDKIISFIKETYNTNSFIPLHEPRFIGNEKNYLIDAIDSTFVSSVGAFVDKFEIMILNNGRSNEIADFPLAGAHSSLASSKGAIDIEMTSLPKDGLEVFPPEILAKLSPKVKISYMYPYDKFQHVLTYDNKELPMDKALGKIQQDMESHCEVRMIENGEYKRWYDKGYGGGSGSSSTPGGKGTSKGQ